MKQSTIRFFKEVSLIYWDLLKVMVPVMILVKLAVQFGVIDVLGRFFEPIVALVGLTPELGLVWVTAMVVNVYAGAAAWVAVLPGNPMTGAEATVLGTMILVAHALPIEQRITQKAGPSLVFTTLLRIIAAIALGALLNIVYSSSGLLQQEISINWLPQTAENADWLTWSIDSLISLTTIFLILVALMALLKLMDITGITALLTRALAPLLRVMGMSENTSSMTMAGVLLGITYGAAMILKEARSGEVDKRDIFLAASFLSLCHGVIEDTLFVMALGAHWSGVLIARVIFSVLVVFLISRALRRLPEPQFDRYLFNPQQVQAAVTQ